MKELIYSMYGLNSYDIQSKPNGMVKLSDNNDQQIKKHVKCNNRQYKLGKHRICDAPKPCFLKKKHPSLSGNMG